MLIPSAVILSPFGHHLRTALNEVKGLRVNSAKDHGSSQRVNSAERETNQLLFWSRSRFLGPENHQPSE